MLLPTAQPQCFALSLLLQQHVCQQFESFFAFRQTQHTFPHTIECGESIGKLTECVRAACSTPAMVDRRRPCFGEREMVREERSLILAATSRSPFDGTADEMVK
jgi:hypothetical protein